MSDIRDLLPSDKPAYERLIAQAFSRGRVLDAGDLAPDETFGDQCVGVFDGEHLRAVVSIVPFDIHWRGAVGGTLSMGGIAGVATEPDARGQGFVDRLLRHALVRMRDAGQTVSALNPFAWAFYRRFGYEWGGERRVIVLPLNHLKTAPEGRFVREVTGDDAKRLLSPVYERYAARYRGMFASESHKWSAKLAHDDNRMTYAYAYFPEGSAEPTAYLLWRYDAFGSDGGEVREFVATTPDGYRALFSLLHYFATQCKTARVTLPADAPVWANGYHWDYETKVSPMFQVRVVNVCAAMGKIEPHGLPNDATAVIRISDEAAPWNDGTFRISVEGGLTLCAPREQEAEPDVTCDIQAFSQAFWGTPSLAALRDAGRIEVTGEAGYETLARLLPASPVFTADFF